jgi:hypothetical protein
MLETFNDAGFLQFRADMSAIAYITKGVATTVARSVSFSAMSEFYIDVSDVYTMPLIAVRHPQTVAPFFVQQMSGFRRHWFVSTNTSVGVNVGYYLFAATTQVAGAVSFGVEVRNASNQIVWNTGATAPDVSHIFTSGSVSLTSGRLYATCIPAFAGYVTRGQIFDNEGLVGYSQIGRCYGARINTSGSYTATIGEVDFQSAAAIYETPVPPNITTPFPGVFVFDVTAFGSIPGEGAY